MCRPLRSFMFECFECLSIAKVELVHSFIHLRQLTSGERQGTPWTGRQTIAGLTHRDKQPFTLTFTPLDNLELSINLVPNLYVFGLWEEAGENPRWHGETMQTPHRRAPTPGIEPATLLLWGESANHHTTVPPVELVAQVNFFFYSMCFCIFSSIAWLMLFSFIACCDLLPLGKLFAQRYTEVSKIFSHFL